MGLIRSLYNAEVENHMHSETIKTGVHVSYQTYTRLFNVNQYGIYYTSL